MMEGMKLVLKPINSWWHPHFISISRLNLTLVRWVCLEVDAQETWGSKHSVMDLGLSSRVDQVWSLVSQIGGSVVFSQNQQVFVGKYCHISVFRNALGVFIWCFLNYVEKRVPPHFFHTLDLRPQCKLLGPKSFAKVTYKIAWFAVSLVLNNSIKPKTPIVYPSHYHGWLFNVLLPCTGMPQRTHISSNVVLLGGMHWYPAPNAIPLAGIHLATQKWVAFNSRKNQQCFIV